LSLLFLKAIEAVLFFHAAEKKLAEKVASMNRFTSAGGCPQGEL
jgi:hypothetical protein